MSKKLSPNLTAPQNNNKTKELKKQHITEEDIAICKNSSKNILLTPSRGWRPRQPGKLTKEVDLEPVWNLAFSGFLSKFFESQGSGERSY